MRRDRSIGSESCQIEAASAYGKPAVLAPNGRSPGAL